MFCDSYALHSSRDIWNVKSERLRGLTGSHSGSVCSSIYLGKFMQDRQGQTIPGSPRPVHGPITRPVGEHFLSTKLVKETD